MMPVAVNAAAHNARLENIEYHLLYTVAKSRKEATKYDIHHALAHFVRARLIEGLLDTEKRLRDRGAKRMAYLSTEYLIGRSLRNNLFNLGLLKEAEVAPAFGFDLNDRVNRFPPPTWKRPEPEI